jgi:hypothetical protein
MSPTKPVFQSVVDLGLRDVGVKNQPRKLAAQVGKSSLLVAVAWVVTVVALCAVLRVTGTHPLFIGGLALAWTAALFALAIRTTKRSPVVVIRLTADGGSKTVSWLIAPYLLLGVPAVVVAGPLGIPVLVLGLGIALFVWQRRDHVPQVLRGLRPLLAHDELVLGDGIGLIPGMRGGYDAFRLIVATDRRLLVTASTRSKGPFLVVDVPYREVDRFGFEWPYRGRLGKLSLTVAGADGAAPETHVIQHIAPANLVSIARALRSHGVEADDPQAISEAELAWEDARRQAIAPSPPLFDHQAMSTRQFDVGLWLLLGLAAVGFWFNPLRHWIDAELLVLLIAFVACVISGYVSGTRSSLAYIVPLNLLVAPAFFFAEVAGVILLMITISLVAAIGLRGGSALRGARAGRASAPEVVVESQTRRAPHGSLRGAISGRRLIQLSGLVLAGMIALASVSSAAGFDPATLRMVVDEVSADQNPVDGKSNLTGNAASFTYTPGRDLKEFTVDEHWDAGPNDGARWELRSPFTKGYNVVSLSHYIFEPHLDDPAAVADFVADKDRQHSKIAGSSVTHTQRVVDGRKGYVWTHGNSRGYWHYAVWFPQPIHTVRVECIAKKQVRRFKRLCAGAIRSLDFH